MMEFNGQQNANNYSQTRDLIDMQDVNNELKIWNKYIDILCDRAENNSLFFRASQYHITESNRLVINVDDTNKNMTILSSLKNSEVVLYYNSDDEDYDESNYYIDPNDISSSEFKRSDKVGTLRTYNTNSNTITIELKDEYLQRIIYTDFSLPSIFYGEISASGDIVQYNRLNKGIKQLRYQISNQKTDIYRALLFCKDKSIVHNLEPICYDEEGGLSTSFLSDNLNEAQKDAIIMALSTKNTISLIQGPPGTGKTTVIAEICYQNAIRGKKTLIASQSNLAIDNALSRLIYSKEIIPIRAGNISRVDIIGEKFTPDKVVRTLFDGSIEQCQKKINQKYYRNRISEIDRIISNIDQLEKNKISIDEDIRRLKVAISISKQRKDGLSSNKYILNEIHDECDSALKLLLNGEIESCDYINKNASLNKSGKYNGKLSKDIDYINNELSRINKFARDNNNFKSEIGILINHRQQLISILSILEKCYRKRFSAGIKNALKTTNIISLNENDKISDAILDYEIEIEEYISVLENKYSLNRLIFSIEEYIKTEYRGAKYVPFGNSNIENCENLYEQYKNEAEVLFDNKPFIFNFTARKKWKKQMSLLYSKVIDLHSKNIQDINKTLRPEFKNEFQYYKSLLINTLCKTIEKKAQIDTKISFDRAFNEVSSIVLRPGENVIEFNDRNILYKIAQGNYDKSNIDFLSLAESQLDTLMSKVNTSINDHNTRINEIQNSLDNYDTTISLMTDNLKVKIEKLISDIMVLKKSFSDSILAEVHSMEKAESDIDDKNKIITHDSKEIVTSLKKILNDEPIENNCDFKICIKRLNQERKMCSEIISENELLEKWCDSINEFSEDMATELYQIIKANANVVAITCVQSASYQFNNDFGSDFDTVVIDEVSKAIPPELILPSLKGKSLILIGDHKQLPPMVDDKTLEEMDESCHDSIKNSVFKVLFENIQPSHKKMLNVQYRMHRQIMNVINCFYDYNLVSGWSQKEERELKSHNIKTKYLDNDVHTFWVDIPNTKEHFEQKDGTSYYSKTECTAINKLLDDINIATTKKMDVAIISFYGAQVWYLKENINVKQYTNLTIKISTVDRFQGAESEIVLVSTVRNNPFMEIGFARSFERINVAFSRAQKLLGIVGCSKIFTNNRDANASNTYTNIYNTIDSVGGIIELGRVLK